MDQVYDEEDAWQPVDNLIFEHHERRNMNKTKVYQIDVEVYGLHGWTVRANDVQEAKQIARSLGVGKYVSWNVIVISESRDRGQKVDAAITSVLRIPKPIRK